MPLLTEHVYRNIHIGFNSNDIIILIVRMLAAEHTLIVDAG
jgi:hypothetical protein